MNNDYYGYDSRPAHYGNPPPISIGSWMLTFFLLAVPLVNIVMLFVWLFGLGGTNPSKANFFRAVLLFYSESK